MTSKSITAFFAGWPSDPLDDLCHTIFERHGGRFIGCGTFVGGDQPERDVECDVPATSIAACKAELLFAGCRVEDTEYEILQ
jgi:hypothetical protein